MSSKRILILIHKKSKPNNDPNWELFQAALEPYFDPTETTITMGAIEDLTYEVSRDGMHIYDLARDFSLEDFDLVVFRIIRKNWARVSACVSLLQAKNIPYIDSLYQPRPVSKYASEFMRFRAGLPVIHTLFAPNATLEELFQNEETAPIKFPCILKDVNGHKGLLNYLVKSPEEMKSRLDENPEVEFIVQEFIPNDGDYRCLVMGGEIKLVIHRRAGEGSHLNNTSQGGTAQVVPIESLSDGFRADVLKAVSVEQLEVAGADLIIDKETGQHYILEVNSSPQLATGASPELKMKAYADYLQKLVGLQN
jgi:glutathione synthase/RimK-type ligase-like ATP-grasp enzyme